MVPDLPVFQPHNIDFVGSLVLIMVLVLTVANSLTPKFAVGGHALNAVFFGSIMCILTGLNLVLIPPVAAGLLLTCVGNQQKWDTFVKERSGGNGSVVGLPEQVVVAFAAG